MQPKTTNNYQHQSFIIYLKKQAVKSSCDWLVQTNVQDMSTNSADEPAYRMNESIQREQ